MEKTLPLYVGPSVIGSVVCSEDERAVTLSAKTYATLQGVYRAYIRGSGGTLLIGVLSPDGHGFSARKTVSTSALSGSGLTFDDITYAFAHCHEKQSPEAISWSVVGSLPESLSKSRILRTLAGTGGALCDCAEAPTRLAVPLFTGKPFPCPDILCLLTPENIDGTVYGVLRINSDI